MTVSVADPPPLVNTFENSQAFSNAVGIPLMVAEVNAVSIQVVPPSTDTCQSTVGVGVPPVTHQSIPRIWAIGGLSEFEALPVDLKDLTHSHLEVVEIRSLAARRDQLGVGTDGQA